MKNFLILSLLLAFLTTEVCAQWKPAGDKIKTQWANKINTSAVLPEYPRPIMERNEWKNLKFIGRTDIIGHSDCGALLLYSRPQIFADLKG